MNNTGKLCGVECIVSKPADVWKILHFADIGLESSYFYVFDQSIYGKEYIGEIPEKVEPAYFSKMNKGNACVERLVLHAYPCDVEPEEIDTYGEYILSPCKMIVLICDTCYVEIYCKDTLCLQSIMQAARELPGISIKEKYEGSDSRTVMYV